MIDVIATLSKDAERTVGEIKRLFDDRVEMRRLLQTDPDLYNEVSIHEWHPTLAWERAARYKPMFGGHYVCPRCYVVSGQNRTLMEMSTLITLVECAYCGYKVISDSVPQQSTQTDAGPECDTQTNFRIKRHP